MKITWTIKQSDSLLLKDFLKSKAISRTLLKELKQISGAIKVNEQPEKVTKELEVGDVVQVTLPSEPAHPCLVPKAEPLSILYEDEYLIAINKPAYLVTLPSPSYPDNSLANYLLHYYQSQDYENQVIHALTRLDKDTSGVIIFAKSGYIHHRLEQTALTKTYLAFVEGELGQKEGLLDYPINRSEDSIITRTVHPDGKPAQTAYKVVEEKNDYSIVEAQLLTGRTHQIRVHFSHIGHPLLGDDLYGGHLNIIERQALHCYRVTLTHPITEKELTLEAPLPNDLAVLK